MSADRPPSVLGSLLAAGARSVLRRFDGGGGLVVPPASPPVVVAADLGGVARVDSRSVLDCGLGGGCGGGAGGSVFGSGGGWATSITPALDRPTIDDILTDELMRRIVAIMVDDAMRLSPTLSGETGELTGCIEWLNARGFWAEAQRAMWYSRAYGGGGVVMIVDDGRRSDEEVDILAVRDVVGFYALPKWYLVPDGVGSGRVRAGWYGTRVGRPEHYFVTPSTALASYVVNSAGAEGSTVLRRERMPDDLLRILNKSGNRFHRSRVIAWPYRDEMDLRLARWQANWNGWGPGVVESCLAPFLARRQGALRLAAIMNSVVVNTMTINDLEHRQSNPDLFALLQARLEMVKWCRDYMADTLPIIATDTANKFDSLTHNVSGIDKLVAAQRQYLLDVLEYPAVVLFGDSVGGMNGGDRKGEWRAWAATVRAKQDSWVWTAGMFGGGLRQAVMLSMACQRGPTSGQMDPSVKATWPSILSDSADDVASVRLKHAQARAQDALTLGLTPAALRRFDPDVAERYPGLDLDEGPLPTVDPATPGATRPQGTTPAVVAPGEAPAAVTPAAVNEALAGPDSGEEAPQDAAPVAPAPLALPDDIATEAEIAAALKMTKAAFRKWVAGQDVATYPMPAGMRGGNRHSLGEVLKAFNASAKRRVDALRAPMDEAHVEALKRRERDGA